jgi:hypothetical protein
MLHDGCVTNEQALGQAEGGDKEKTPGSTTKKSKKRKERESSAGENVAEENMLQATEICDV